MVDLVIKHALSDQVGDLLEWAYGEDANYVFWRQLTDGHRVGQAFMNALRLFDHDEYLRLTGSLDDPYYNDYKLPAALDRLTRK